MFFLKLYMPEPLYTPDQVAALLQISVRTVYAEKHRFGGFYPAGLKVLRFPPEVINGIISGQGQGVALRFYGGREEIHQSMVPDKSRGNERKRNPQKRSAEEIREASIRFGLRDSDGRIPEFGRKKKSL
jgi:hypothetical protein